ncbi:MAG: hypothetical protein HY540_06800 [Deltaproteobacteria bacterium]|nr:hypothetical protein [Deltaproteobacteria bacterium]
MKTVSKIALAVVLAAFIACSGSSGGGTTPRPGDQSGDQSSSTGKSITINGIALNSEEIQKVVEIFGSEPPTDIHFWYDKTAHLYGLEGQAAAGIFDLAANGIDRDFGDVSETSSSGDTSVFINGRRLPSAEVDAIKSLCNFSDVPDGRYDIDASGIVSLNGQFLVNLVTTCVQSKPQRRSPFLGSVVDARTGGDSSCNYVSMPGMTVTSPGCG